MLQVKDVKRMWFEFDDWKVISGIFLVATGFAALGVFNLTYFLYVLPYMKRHRGGKASFQAALGLIHGQVFEYCRLARENPSKQHRRAAFAIKMSLGMFMAAFLVLAILVLIDIRNRPN